MVALVKTIKLDFILLRKVQKSAITDSFVRPKHSFRSPRSSKSLFLTESLGKTFSPVGLCQLLFKRPEMCSGGGYCCHAVP